MTQEAAYTSLLRTRRTALHTAIGLAIQTLYSERLAEHYEALAYHFTQGQCWLEAYRYSRLAGDKAREAYANRDAVDFYTQALEVSQSMSPALSDAELLGVYEARGLVRRLLTQYDEAIVDFQHMLNLARTARDLRQEGESLCHLAFAHWSKFSEDHFIFVEQYA